MTQDFLEIQKYFHKSPEGKRFYWQTTHPYISKREQELLSDISQCQHPMALELGSGEGANTINLRKIGWKTSVIGIDYSPEKAVFSNSSRIPNAKYLAGDITKIPFRNNSFDLVYCRDVFHHILSKREALHEIARVTRPGGEVILIEGNVLKLSNRVFSWINPTERGLKDSTPAKFQKLIQSAEPKLKIKEIKMAEPSNLFRFFFHYSIGFPSFVKSSFLLRCLNWLEKQQLKLIAQNKWAYMVFKLEKRM